MKHFMLSMLAFAGVLSASAVPTYTVSPVQGSELPSRSNLEVKFTFSEEVTVNAVEFVGGTRFSSVYSSEAVEMSAPSKEVKIAVPESAWGEQVGGNYYLEVILNEIYDAAGDLIVVKEEGEDEEGNPTIFTYNFTANSNYTTPYVSAAEYMGTDPNPEDTTVWDVYMDGWGFVNFLFSDVVNLPDDAYAKILFSLDGAWITQTVSFSDLWADWDWWTGYYAITVPMCPNSNITEEDLESIEVTLYNVAEKPLTVNYDLTADDVKKIPGVKKLNTTAGISSIEDISAQTIYDINGNLINTTSIKSLSNGVYIVNGKKLLVR